MPSYDLDDQAAIVTGAGRGIGRAIALRLAHESAGVTVADLDLPNAQGVAGEIAAAGGQAFVIQVDVTSKDDMERMVSETVARFGRLDILVNNAGVAAVASLLDTDEATWDLIMNVTPRVSCSHPRRPPDK